MVSLNKSLTPIEIAFDKGKRLTTWDMAFASFSRVFSLRVGNPWRLYSKLFGVGIYNSKVHLQSIGGRTAQVIARGESGSSSRAEEVLMVVKLSLHQHQT